MKDKTAQILEYLFGVLLICQVGAIIFFNLSDIRCSLDHDAANAVYHVMEMIKNRTIRLPDWNHTTSLEIVNCFIFAVPIFFVVKNIYLSIIVISNPQAVRTVRWFDIYYSDEVYFS